MELVCPLARPLSAEVHLSALLLLAAAAAADSKQSNKSIRANNKASVSIYKRSLRGHRIRASVGQRRVAFAYLHAHHPLLAERRRRRRRHQASERGSRRRWHAFCAAQKQVVIQERERGAERSVHWNNMQMAPRWQADRRASRYKRSRLQARAAAHLRRGWRARAVCRAPSTAKLSPRLKLTAREGSQLPLANAPP